MVDLLAQVPGPDHALQSLREFGVAVTVMAIMIGAFLWGVYKLREDGRKDLERLTRLIDDQRTAFVAVLTAMQAEAKAEAKAWRDDMRATLADQARGFQTTLDRIEAYWQRALADICRYDGDSKGNA